MTIDQLMDELQSKIASPAHQARKNALEPRFYTYLENLGEVQLFGYNLNKYLTNAVFNCEMQLRQKLFCLENFSDDSFFGMDVSAAVGMYFEYTLVGLDVRHQDDGVPHIQDDHPLSVTPDLKLLKPHDFKTSGFMPRIFRLYEDLKKLGKDRLNVIFPIWQRGPLDMAIQLRGYDRFIMDTAERPEFVHGLMKYLNQERMRWWEAYRQFSGSREESAQIHDDWINVPFISPAMFEEFVLPRYLELEAFHGKIPYIHSCGNKVPVQKMLEQIKTLEVHEVNHWTDLEATLSNVPAIKFLNISLLNTEVLLADEVKMRRELQRIVRLCQGRHYSVCAQAIEKVHDDMAEDIAQVKRWLVIAREVLRPAK